MYSQTENQLPEKPDMGNINIEQPLCRKNRETKRIKLSKAEHKLKE